MSYYRRPYLSTLPISSDYLSKREYSYEYSTSAGKDYDMYDYYWSPRRRYYPVYEYSPDYKYESTRIPIRPYSPYASSYVSPYYPDYRTTLSTPYGHYPRFSDSVTKTVTRVGPYGGLTTRTYRY